MIEFKSVSYKNFQSVGNSMMTINLDRSQNTLLGGNNGSGKSTVLESLSYCLFGKPLKKVKLSGLINTINRKNMLTECVFTKYGDEYKIVRGEKPKVFKIFKNDELLDQNAASKDYQFTLENVIGMDHKLFTQIVLLNRERYVPFMDMVAADRRKVVEDILDINVFGYMNKVVKSNVDALKAQISDTEYERGLKITKREGVENLIEQAKANINEQINERQEECNNNNIKKDELNLLNFELEKELSAFDGIAEQHQKLKDKKQKLNDFSHKFSIRISELKKERAFYDDNDECPTCTQVIDGVFKQGIITGVESKKAEIDDKSAVLLEQLDKVSKQIEDLSQSLNEKIIISNKINTNNNEIHFITRENGKLSTFIEDFKKRADACDHRPALDELNETIQAMDDDLNHLMNECEEYESMRSMLKDDGIKASIVDDYVGFINKRMNEYLNHMGFFINITLDGNFDEKINSVNKEGFTYDNLSTGEKTRVSIAILLVLLEVSAMKNSATTNILFLDEIMENLDSDGVSSLMDLIKEKMKYKNVFVITQRADEFRDFFRSEITFKKGGDGFASMVC